MIRVHSAVESFSGAPRRRFSWRLACVCVILGVVGVPVSSYGQSRPSISIAWDANPEPGVVGYVVYVGTASGVYTSTYDVGNRTSFTYAAPLQGRRYYFSVAAYAVGKAIGHRSAEISEAAGSPPAASFAAAAAVPPPAPSAAPSLEGSRSRTPASSARTADGTAPMCEIDSDATCYQRRVRAWGLGAITAFAAAPDGRLFAIEDGVHLRTIGGGGPDDTSIALTIADSSTRLTGLALDPHFARTGYLFVGLTRTGPDGRRQLSIVRYRDVQGHLGEPMVVIAGLHLSGTGDAPFVVDGAGRLYVAMPADPGSRRDPYAGYVLWYNLDGSVPSSSRGGSPILAHGYHAPLALALADNRLWLAGAQADWPSSIARVEPVIPDNGAWPLVPVLAQVPRPVAAGGSALRTLSAGTAAASGGGVIVDTAGRVHRLRMGAPEDPDRLRTLAWPDGQHAVAAAAGAGQELYVVLQQPDGTSAVEELSAQLSGRGGAASNQR